jgi:uncharacterized protein (TIRG00374 family)
MGAENQSLWRNVLRLLLGVALLVALIKVFQVGEWRKIYDFTWAYMVGAGIVSLGANVVGTLRWEHALRAVGAEDGLNFTELLKLYMSGTVLGFAFVGATGSLAYQSLALKKQWNIPYTKIAFSLTLDRVLDPFLSMVIFIVALFYLSGQMNLEYFSVAIYLLIGVSVVFLVIGRSYLRIFFRFSLECIHDVGRLGKRIKSVFGQPNSPRTANPGIRKDLDVYRFSPTYLASLSLGRVVLLLVRLQLVACALGVMIPWEIILIGMSVFQLSWLLSVTPGGIGIAEWGWVGVLVRYGFSPSDAALLSIAFRLYLFIFSVVVLLVSFAFYLYIKKRSSKVLIE